LPPVSGYVCPSLKTTPALSEASPAVHGLAVLAGQGPLRDVPDATRRRLEELTFTFIGEALS
jgi:hypothetical protein